MVDALVEQRELRRREVEEEEEEEAERKVLSEPIPEAENSDDEWYGLISRILIVSQISP